MGEEQIAVAIVALATSVPVEVSIGGRPVLEWVLSALGSVPRISEIIVAPQVEAAEYVPDALRDRVRWCLPQVTRLRAIRAALQVAQPSGSVLVHDADQPLVTPRWLAAVLAGTTDHPGMASGVPVKAAYKRVADGVIEQTVPRDRLVRLLGPRAFRRDVLTQVFQRAELDGWRCDDEVRVARLAGISLVVHPAAELNIRVSDAVSAELAERLAACP